MKLVSVLLISAVFGGVVAWRPTDAPQPFAPVVYPEGYRSWAHVKSTTITSAHQNFARMGGFQHFYANAKGMEGYRTRVFPEGSVVVVDWLQMDEKDGVLREGSRRQVDVMVKDSVKFAETGGWGFQRFAKDSKTELAAAPTPAQCFACHTALKKDGLVLSSYRP